MGENGASDIKNESEALLAIRPEDVILMPKGLDNNDKYKLNVMQARIEGLEYRGPIFRVTLRLPMPADLGPVIESDIPSEKIERFNLREEMDVPICFPADRLRVYNI